MTLSIVLEKQFVEMRLRKFDMTIKPCTVLHIDLIYFDNEQWVIRNVLCINDTFRTTEFPQCVRFVKQITD